MRHKVLFVDNDINMLASAKRMLGKQFDMTTALSGEEGLEIVRDHGPFAVIISDLLMGGMDGFKFLNQVNNISPASACILLTGHANLQLSLRAVNEGGIFRFLTKPCKNHIFSNAVSEGVRQYKRNTESLSTSQRSGEEQDLKSLPEAVMEELYAGPRGIIDGISTTAFLQMIEMEEKTCTLTVRASGRVGVMYLFKARIKDDIHESQ